jgi:hypothetical protein
MLQPRPAPYFEQSEDAYLKRLLAYAVIIKNSASVEKEKQKII